MSLTEDFQGSGRNVTCDNYFTDLKLAESLAKTKLTMIGTIKRNKTFLPLDFQEKKAISLGESKFLFRNETTLLSYQRKRQKNVLLLSTMHSKAEIVAEKNNKPKMVLAYNKTKGGVDAMDQMAHAFTTKRKTKRWPMVIFFNMRRVHVEVPLSPMSHEDNRQKFNLNIGRSLALPQIMRRAAVPTLQEPVCQNITNVLYSSSQHLSQHKSIQPRKEDQITQPLKNRKDVSSVRRKKTKKKKKTTDQPAAPARNIRSPHVHIAPHKLL